MNINKNESLVLFKHKIIAEGKDEVTANQEIMRDKIFEKGLTIKNREVKSLQYQLEKAYKRIAFLENKIKEKSNIKFKEKFKQLQNSVDGNYASTKDCMRIISIIENEGKIGLSDLSKTCGFNKSKIRDNAVSFLIKCKIIKQSVGLTKYNQKVIYLERC